MFVATSGLSIEFMITLGSVSDIKAARLFDFNIPHKSKIHADFSLIIENFSRKIYPVTAHRFKLKIYMFIFAYFVGFLVAS